MLKGKRVGPIDEMPGFSWADIDPGRTKIQYRPDCLLIFNQGGRRQEPDTFGTYNDQVKEKMREIRDRRFTGTISSSAQKNLARSFDNLLTASRRQVLYNRYIRKSVPFQLNMITLTIPDGKEISSKEGNARLLKPFLQRMERYCLQQYRKLPLYSWKIELQQRGQLHWHIITNRWVPHEWIARAWSEILFDATFMRDYYRKTGSRIARAATRVESVRRNSAGEMRLYLLKKYARKKVVDEKKVGQDRAAEMIAKIDGHVWGCSRVLRSNYPAIIATESDYLVLKNFIQAKTDQVVSRDFCCILRTPAKGPPHECILGKFRAVIKAHREYIRINGEIGLKKIFEP